MKKYLALEEIRPFVRFAQNVHIAAGKKPVTLQSYDHRIFYVLSGIAGVKAGSIVRQALPGTLLYWMSGTPYSIYPANQEALEVIAINFDFLSEHNTTIQYLPMVLPSEFVPEKCLEHISFTDAQTLNEPLFFSDIPAVLPFLKNILQEAASAEIFSRFQLSSLLCTVIGILYRNSLQKNPPIRRGTSHREILTYIQNHYADNLSNQSLAHIFNYHPHYISQLISKHTGVPLHQYLLKIRIQQSIYLLLNTDIPIHEIARQVGFCDVSYFSQYFKKCTGYPPSAFRIR